MIHSFAGSSSKHLANQNRFSAGPSGVSQPDIAANFDKLLAFGADGEIDVLIDVQRRHAGRFAGRDLGTQVQGQLGVLLSVAGHQHGAAGVGLRLAGI